MPQLTRTMVSVERSYFKFIIQSTRPQLPLISPQRLFDYVLFTQCHPRSSPSPSQKVQANKKSIVFLFFSIFFLVFVLFLECVLSSEVGSSVLLSHCSTFSSQKHQHIYTLLLPCTLDLVKRHDKNKKLNVTIKAI